MAIRKKVLALTMIGAVAITGVGCDIKTDTPVIGKFVGLKDNEIIKIGSSICTAEETKIVLMNLQNQYKKDFGQDVVWKQQMGDTTMEEYILDKVKSDLSVVYAMSALADDEKITLTDEEKNLIEQAAKEYYDGLNESEKKYADITTDSVESVYTNYYLADKVYADKTAGISESISDEEARVMKIQYIYIDTAEKDEEEAKETLKQVKKQVENGYQDFLVQANRHGDNEIVEINIKKNEADEEYELKAFELTNDAISKVITEENGVYLVKCINSYLEAETQANKAQIIMDSKIKAFNEAYSSYVEESANDFNTDAWKKIELSTDTDVTASNLFEIYEKYLGEINQKSE